MVCVFLKNWDILCFPSSMKREKDSNRCVPILLVGCEYLLIAFLSRLFL
jgi:hypothetical protein